MNEFENLLQKYPRVFVLYDRKVEKFALSVAGEHKNFGITADEKYKTLDTAVQICRWLLEEGADRDALLLCIGGGFTSDVGGFAASIYKRGIRHANIPTTLLSMVDAAIGGKTGVNLDGYKNMLGTFSQPEFTYLWPEALNTLPSREWRSGTAELLKTFLIADAKAYENALRVLHTGFKELPDVISEAAGIKQEIVNQDPEEQGLRRILNLGHTFAHAIEWWQKDAKEPLSHGEAVSIGIVRAAAIGEKLGLSEKGIHERIKDDFARCNLPVDLPCDQEELLGAIAKDKKAEDGLVNYVIPVAIGKTQIVKLSIDDLRLP